MLTSCHPWACSRLDPAFGGLRPTRGWKRLTLEASVKLKLLTSKRSNLLEPLVVTYTLITEAVETLRFITSEGHFPRAKLVPVRARKL